MTRCRSTTRVRPRQGGVVAIEFAIMFPLFLLIFYAIVSYSLLFVYEQGLHTLSADAVRQAIAVERDSDGTLNQSAIEAEVTDFISSDEAHWPASLASLCEGEVGGISVENDPDSVRVCVQATLDLPQIDFKPFGIDVVIPAMTTVESRSSIRL